jgi:tetraprenyl-beta-curcumene synthase
LLVRLHSGNPTRRSLVFSIPTLLALAAATGRELGWGLRAVSRETQRWRSLAESIPDYALRQDALKALNRKRGNIEGAALFWILPRHRSPELLRLLIAYEILADYLDCTSERAACVGIKNGLQLHRALLEAVEHTLDVSDYYLYHPWYDDGGYVRALVQVCRETCPRLPSYPTIRPFLAHAASLTHVLALNHEPDPDRRDAALKRWSRDQGGDRHDLTWFESAGSASAWLTVLALLALATEPGRQELEARLIYATYLPWISLTCTMLDSYADAEEDAQNGDHSYISHYSSREEATTRIAGLIRRSMSLAKGLPGGHRHTVITSCMIALYLSKDTARTPETSAISASFARAAGPLTRLLVPVLRIWRVLYRQRTA